MGILDECEKIKDTQKRKAALLERLTTFSRPHMEFYGAIPKGFYYASKFWPSQKELNRSFEESDYFYYTIQQWCGKDQPPIVTRLLEEYHSNKAKMYALASLPEEERRVLPSHEFPPYCSDFDKEIRKDTEYQKLIQDYVFTPNFVASGGMADIYKIKDTQEKEYALKLFHPIYKRVPGEREFWPATVEKILNNVGLQQEFLTQEPFIPIRFMTKKSWYIMDWVSEPTIREILDENTKTKRKTKDSWETQTVSAYGHVLKKLQQHNLVFMDQCWSAVFLTPSSIKIGDLDFIAPLEDANNQYTTITNRPHHFIYASREHLLRELPYSYSSELESFALLIDHLYNKNSWRKLSLYGLRCD